MQFIYCDGGRKDAGFAKTRARDCVTRAVCIITRQSYKDVHDFFTESSLRQRKSKKAKIINNADDGIYTTRKWFKDYPTSLGYKWTPTMLVGQGCKVHLVDGELPMGRLIVSVSRHYTAVIDGVIFDIGDPQRGEKRCVYGYWSKST